MSVTLSYGEGNGHAIPGTGLLMNNFLGEADLFPHGFHRFTPGERLNSMMAPSVIQESSGTVTALGTGGSNRIRTVVPQVISALLDDRLAPHEAVHRARIHLEDGVLSAETYLLRGREDALTQVMNLATTVESFDAPSLFFGGVHLVRQNAAGGLEGVGDVRRGGSVRMV